MAPSTRLAARRDRAAEDGGKMKSLAPRLKSADTRRVKPPPAKVPDPFYSSPEWRALVAAVIAERGRSCERCGAEPSRIFGDHIVEMKDGGAPLDKRNVMLLCG